MTPEICKTYLAVPCVLLPDAISVGHRKQQRCRIYGFEGLFSLDIAETIKPRRGAIVAVAEEFADGTAPSLAAYAALEACLKSIRKQVDRGELPALEGG